MPARYTCSSPLTIPAQTSSEAVEEVKSKAKGKKSTGEKTARVTANLDEASLIVVSPVVLYLWHGHQSCEKKSHRYKRGCLEVLLRPGVWEDGGNGRSHCAEE